VLVIAVVMASADSSVVLLAFPDMTQSLATNVSTSLWTILAYMLVTAVMTTQLGKVGDTYGRAKMFNAGFVVFTAASALCGAAPTIIFLIGCRVIQGVGAAMIVANSGAIVADTFPREQLGRAYGYISSGWGVGAILGIVLGGALTTLLGWRYIFYINVPIGIVAMILGFKYVRNKSTVKRNIDLFGMLLLGIAMLLVSYDAISVAAVGFSYTDAGLIALGVLIIIALLWKERNTKDALIDLSVFKSRVLRFSLLAALFVSLGYFAVFFMITLYLQGIIGLTPLNAAILLSPGAIIGFLLSPRMGRLSDKIGAGVVATAGIGCLVLAVLVYLTISPTPSGFSWLTIVIASTIAGFGTAMFFPSNNSAVMSNAAQGAYGSVNGLLRTMQNVGGLMSYAVVIYVAATAVPRSVAFQVFVGATTLLGGLDAAFVGGIKLALIGCAAILICAAALSYARGRAHHADGNQHVAQWQKNK
jgi:EmrB/QacA subfamily drug resistance transporter